MVLKCWTFSTQRETKRILTYLDESSKNLVPIWRQIPEKSPKQNSFSFMGHAALHPSMVDGRRGSSCPLERDERPGSELSTNCDEFLCSWRHPLPIVTLAPPAATMLLLAVREGTEAEELEETTTVQDQNQQNPNTLGFPQRLDSLRPTAARDVLVG